MSRWSAATIAEEHRFVAAAAEAEIPVVRHLPLKKSLKEIPTLAETDSHSGKIFYTLFPKFRGREHSEISDDDRRWLGRMLGRLHNIGETFSAPHRMRLTPQTYGTDSLRFIVTQEFLPPDLKNHIETCLVRALELLSPFFTPDQKGLSLHGDSHPGNILWNKEGPHLLDFDDMVVAPPVQDLWMHLNGTEEEQRTQKKCLLEGYEVFRRFDESSWILTEPLRTLRMIRYAAWIGQRYSEPAFQRAFPYYRERRYWEEFLQAIKEQIGLLQELSWT